MRILLLIAPKDYGGVAAAEGNSPAAASAIARIPVSGESASVRPSVRPAWRERMEMEWAVAAASEEGLTEETREGGSAARQAGGGNQQLPSQSLPLSLSLSLCLSLPSRFTTKTTL